MLTAIVVVLIGGFSVVYLGAVDDRASGQSPLVDAEVTAAADRVSITHVSGEPVPLAELEILLRNGSASERYTLDAANVSGNGDDRFDPGERFRRHHGLGGGQLDVRLVHTDSNAVLDRASLDI